MTDLRIVFFDVENTGMLLQFEAYDLFKRGGHYPRHTDIVEPRRLFSFQAKPLGGKPVWASAITPEQYAPMIVKMHRVLSAADVLVGWNSKEFDWKKAQHAFFLLGMERIPEPFQVDLMKVAKKNFDFESNSLAYVSRTLLSEDEAKLDTGFSVKALIDRIKLGDKRALTLLKKYGLRDVTSLEALWPRFRPYVQLPVSGAPTDDDRVHRACGGSDTEGRGYRRTLQGVFPRRFCRDCGVWYTVTRSVDMARTREM